MLKKQIKSLLFGETDEKTITEIWIINDATGEKKLYGKFPNDKNLKVIANSPATAETFLKLRNPLSIEVTSKEAAEAVLKLKDN